MIWKSYGRNKNLDDEIQNRGQVLKYNAKNCINLLPDNHLLRFKRQIRAVTIEAMK